MKLSDSQVETLRIINIVIFLLFLFILGFILHNLYRYIYGLKIYRPLIVIFYGLIFIDTILRMIEASVRIYETRTAFFMRKQAFYRSD